MGAILGFIPILGPIIQGIISIFNKKMDTDVQKLDIKTKQQAVETTTSAQIIHDTQDDIGLRLMRDLLIFPVIVWVDLLVWDTIIAESSYRDWMWHVASFEKTGAPYLPYAVVVFLLGNIGINMWNRK